ncbi:hypothetical protein KC330_g1794 [Hortaea werneckii]|nr:hypothetical protein KC330_g1794 [Hortaea werneckii]
MAGTDTTTYSDTARALASQYEDDDDDHLISANRHNNNPSWQRRSSSQRPDQRPRWMQSAENLQNKGLRLWFHFTPLQRTGIVILNLVLFVLTVLALVYNERILTYFAPAAERWREMPAGWLILWFMTFFVSFPPMIGYSTCVTIGGFVFGMKGWFILASATIVGSTCSFIVSKTLLKGYVSRIAEQNKRFAALSLVLKHDGLKLLVMMRLCPLPYSFSNGAISTIPTVTWQNFALATAIASPKLLLHIFVGSRLGDLAENGDKMDGKTKAVSYISILIGMIAGALTGYFIYSRTKVRARELEAEEAEAAQHGGRRSESGNEYNDDPDERRAINALRRDDDVSLHTTYEDDLEGGRPGYSDDFTDDEDAQERDVFDEGDGASEPPDEDDKR